MLAVKPNHRVGEAPSWTSTRRSWARGMAKILKRRPRAAIEAAIAFLPEQAGQPYAFAVESASSLDEKLDRIEAAMKRAAAPPSRREPGTVSYAADPYRPLAPARSGS